MTNWSRLAKTAHIYNWRVLSEAATTARHRGQQQISKKKVHCQIPPDQGTRSSAFVLTNAEDNVMYFTCSLPFDQKLRDKIDRYSTMWTVPPRLQPSICYSPHGTVAPSRVTVSPRICFSRLHMDKFRGLGFPDQDHQNAQVNDEKAVTSVLHFIYIAIHSLQHVMHSTNSFESMPSFALWCLLYVILSTWITISMKTVRFLWKPIKPLRTGFVGSSKTSWLIFKFFLKKQKLEKRTGLSFFIQILNFK
jgi:hypothetical protein